jgi:hypothetical protein
MVVEIGEMKAWAGGKTAKKRKIAKSNIGKRIDRQTSMDCFIPFQKSNLML